LLPFQIETVLIEGGVLPKDAKFFSADLQRSIVFQEINKQLNNPLFVARILTNNLKPADYEKIALVEPFIRVISLFMHDEISHELLHEMLNRLLEDNHYDYLRYIKENYEGRYWNVLPKDVASFCSDLFSMRNNGLTDQKEE